MTFVGENAPFLTGLLELRGAGGTCYAGRQACVDDSVCYARP
jgi:hypothetical protein